MGVYTIVYFMCFLLLEHVIDPRKATIIHCTLDDYIPFCEYFIVPYVLWFVFIPSVLFLLLFKDRSAFWKMASMMFTGNMLCLAIYAVFPNAVITKHSVEDTNIFCTLVNILYASDTATNVCPSIHALDTMAAHIAIHRSDYAKSRRYLKMVSFVFLVLICIATVTLKQHSIIDVVASFCLILILERVVYKKPAESKKRAKYALV